MGYLESEPPQAYFVVRLNNGQIETTAGKATAAFLSRFGLLLSRTTFEKARSEGC